MEYQTITTEEKIRKGSKHQELKISEFGFNNVTNSCYGTFHNAKIVDKASKKIPYTDVVVYTYTIECTSWMGGWHE